MWKPWKTVLPTERRSFDFVKLYFALIIFFCFLFRKKKENKVARNN